MENVQDQGAMQDPMTVDAAEQQESEIGAEELYEALTTEPEEEEAQEPEAEEPELTPEEKQKQAVVSDIRSLMDDGLTGEELKAIARDKGVREAVQNGKPFRQAVMAYLRGQIGGAAAKPAKRGIPTATRPATAGASDHSAIAEMSDEEFARFSEKATRLAKEGKRVSMR